MTTVKQPPKQLSPPLLSLVNVGAKKGKSLSEIQRGVLEKYSGDDPEALKKETGEAYQYAKKALADIEKRPQLEWARQFVKQNPTAKIPTVDGKMLNVAAEMKRQGSKKAAEKILGVLDEWRQRGVSDTDLLLEVSKYLSHASQNDPYIITKAIEFRREGINWDWAERFSKATSKYISGLADKKLAEIKEEVIALQDSRRREGGLVMGVYLPSTKDQQSVLIHRGYLLLSSTMPGANKFGGHPFGAYINPEDAAQLTILRTIRKIPVQIEPATQQQVTQFKKDRAEMLKKLERGPDIEHLALD